MNVLHDLAGQTPRPFLSFPFSLNLFDILTRHSVLNGRRTGIR